MIPAAHILQLARSKLWSISILRILIEPYRVFFFLLHYYCNFFPLHFVESYFDIACYKGRHQQYVSQKTGSQNITPFKILNLYCSYLMPDLFHARFMSTIRNLTHVQIFFFVRPNPTPINYRYKKLKRFNKARQPTISTHLFFKQS